MAKGDVVMQFQGVDQGTVKLLQEMRAELAKLSQQGEQAGKSFEAVGDNIVRGLKAGAAELIGFTTLAGGAAAAVGVLKDAVRDYFQQMEQRSGAYLGRVGSINDALAAAGQSGSVQQVQAMIADLAKGAIGGRQYSQTEISGAFTGISSAVGARLTPEQALAAAKFSLEAESRLVLMSGENGAPNPVAEEVGINYANLQYQRSQGGFKGLSDEQLQNLAYKTTVAAGPEGGFSLISFCVSCPGPMIRNKRYRSSRRHTSNPKMGAPSMGYSNPHGATRRDLISYSQPRRRTIARRCKTF